MSYPGRFLVACWLVGAVTPHIANAQQPLAEQYLLDGKLADGQQALLTELEKNPADDEARFGLGVVQFLRTFERLGAGFYRNGLRTQRAFAGIPRELRDALPQHPDPDQVSYEDLREMVRVSIHDMKQAEATLARIKDQNVKLRLRVGQMKVDLFGIGQPVPAMRLLGRQQGFTPEQLQQLTVAFDYGDAQWLRGYCNFFAAWGEVLLAVDGQEIFDRTAHIFFEKPKSPHLFLQEENRNLDDIRRFDRQEISDLIAFIHLWHFPMKEPERMKAALAHFEAMIGHSREMWEYFMAETDDDFEWIPNPQQQGALRIAVSPEMIDAWRDTLDEAQLVLQGKRLVPFCGGTKHDFGVNLRRVFTEPRTIDVILWVQGTAATPYLERGTVTEFAAPRMLRRLDQTFGGTNFFGFAFWFN